MPAHDVVIIGAGQAGLSASRALAERGVEHVVLEKGRIAQSWRSARWDSFCMVTPNWSIRLAGELDGPVARDGALDPDGFIARDDFVAYLERYAGRGNAPVATGVEITRVRPRAEGGFVLHEAGGALHQARVVVVATATHCHPRRPALAGTLPDTVCSLHASEYRNPERLPPGAVLVVGSAQSGAQIAEELNRAGRRTHLATSTAGRLPRRYRGLDAIRWQQLFGFLDRPASALADPAHRFRAEPHLSGRDGGRSLDLRRLAASGVRLHGRLVDVGGDRLRFDDSLHGNVLGADEAAARFVRDAEALVTREGLDLPLPDTDNSDIGGSDEAPLPDAPRELGIDAAGITSVIWATGFRFDFGFIEAPVLDRFGYPLQRDGRTPVPGLHFLGLNYLERRGSGILYGVGEDAHALAAVIDDDLGRGRGPTHNFMSGPRRK